ncbi:FtsQ-type POTRA domain-containing protein [Hoyosella sp. G463]|uniref:FtsQ-type POTRA domain-containing protein n=1 Tax=Lolliginicoccus lacisalsi TaxID=2742202 RepID=A0A927JEF4_9ACTN|nr:FtsQ-type POTRA domain-containing protein [Lolliginicoccus lacisalsi]MBD8507764.1 FtsQ-type POTRA domain-containing protein [Lolliginicoccus lacisalsi]
MAGILVVGLLVGGFAVAWFSSLLSVRSIEVQAAPSVPEEAVRGVIGVPGGTPLLQVDTHDVAARVAGIPKVAEARVSRALPSTLRVEILERVPAVFFDAPGGSHLMDAEGVVFAVEPPPEGLPRLVTDEPGEDDPATRAALDVLASLAGELRAMVLEARAGSPVDVRLALSDGRTVIWGDAGDSAYKARVAQALLTQPGQVYDVSSPSLPVIR